MAQETRKDPRAKVLTMTVRYKSATIDEFIEHHSYDVSRGGIFIKTPSPFLPGTLLKFEIRIADDKPMLQGVGRVVWKRDATAAAAPDKPAGMGVKFIKVDEASRSLIDRLVASQGSGGSAFDAELPADGGTSQPQVPVQGPPAAAAPRPVASSGGQAAARAKSYKGTMIGLGTDAGAAATAAPAAAGAKQPAAAQQAPVPTSPTAGTPRTIGSSSDEVTQKARPPRPEPMFPKTESFAEMPPPEERTVMKQAAELLKEALREAGGSLDDVGAAPAQGRGKVSTGAGAPAGAQRAGAGATAEAVAAVAASSGRVASKPSSVAAPSESPKDLPPESARGKSPRPAQDGRASRPATAVAVVPPAEKKRGTSAGMTWWLLLVIGASAAAYSAWPRQASAPEPAPAPAVPAAAVPPTTAALPAGSAVPVLPAAGAVSPVPGASAMPGASASASPPEMAPPENPAPMAAESAAAAAAEAPASAAPATASAAPPSAPAAPAPVAPAVQAVHAAQPPPAPAPPRPAAPPPAPPKPVVETAPPPPPPVKVAPAAVPPKPKPAPPPPKPASPKPSDDNPY